jgi:hypothetical protein
MHHFVPLLELGMQGQAMVDERQPRGEHLPYIIHGLYAVGLFEEAWNLRHYIKKHVVF